ncbi:heavy metal translocating P-type ATPase, partial [Pseudomonas aeruginosa]|nr:heavy metal translocating P-type ATPase [Pseudomonas aeruginosa]
MPRIPWSIDLALLVLAAVTLAAGGMCAAFGAPSLARFAWLLGTVPVLLALTVSLAMAAAKRQAGIDVLAWLCL